jgi:hypothetical protein
MDYLLDTQPTEASMMKAFETFAKLSEFDSNLQELELLLDVLALYFSINFRYSVCIPLAIFTTDCSYLLGDWLQMFNTNHEQVKEIERIVQQGKILHPKVNNQHGPLGKKKKKFIKIFLFTRTLFLLALKGKAKISKTPLAIREKMMIGKSVTEGHASLNEALDALEIAPYETVQENIMAYQEAILKNFSVKNKKFSVEWHALSRGALDLRRAAGSANSARKYKRM